MLHLVFTVSMVTRYLSTCKDAVTTAAHNGVAFSKLDVEKAIRLKAAEKATAAPAAPTDGGRPLTLGEARRALVEASEPGVRALEGENARGLQRLQDAFREAKEGRLFVVENLPTETVSAREADACAAFRSGDLRPPFPNTFILATISGVQVPYLFGVKENDVTKDGFSHLCIIFSVVRENGRIVWRTLPGGSPDWEIPNLRRCHPLSSSIAAFPSFLSRLTTSSTRPELRAASRRSRHTFLSRRRGRQCSSLAPLSSQRQRRAERTLRPVRTTVAGTRAI